MPVVVPVRARCISNCIRSLASEPVVKLLSNIPLVAAASIQEVPVEASVSFLYLI